MAKLQISPSALGTMDRWKQTACGPFFDPFSLFRFCHSLFFAGGVFFAKGVLIVFGIALSIIIPSAPLPSAFIPFRPPTPLCCVTTRTKKKKRPKAAPKAQGTQAPEKKEKQEPLTVSE